MITHYLHFILSASHLVSEITDTIIVHVNAVYRPNLEWKHNDFFLAGQIHHGTRPIGQIVLTQPFPITNSLYPRIVFENVW